MSEQPVDRVQTVFDQAVALPPADRAAFLEAACAGDPDLRAEVEGLLACDADFPAGAGHGGLPPGPLVRTRETTAAAASEPSPAIGPPAPLVRMGHYRVLRLIAEGG